MKSNELELIKNLLDDYAEIVFDNVHEHNRQTTIDLVKALKIVKREIVKRQIVSLDNLRIISCKNGVGEWEISPLHETFDTRGEAEKRLKELTSK